MRWIVFDDESAEAITDKYKRGAAELHYGEHPLDAALARGRSLLILPSADPEKVLLARIESRNGKVPSKSHGVIGQFTPLRTMGRQSSAPAGSPPRRQQ